MVFSSSTFLFLFLPAILILYFVPLKKSINVKNLILLCCSLLFYAWGEPLFVFLMVFSILVTWIIGIKLESSTHRKLLVSIIITYHVIVLFVFKYLTFVAKELGLLFGYNSAVSIALPIGISFFTLQSMSYIFDVYRGNVPAQKKLTNLVLYVSFFPQLIAGPIVRYNTICSEIDNRSTSADDIIAGSQRFIIGLSKKLLLSDYLAVIADYSFSNINNQSVTMAWLGAITYSLQIYFDFSGYSDMAIGLGRIFGFHFNENFNYPYVAKSVTDFWRRWHISLSSWFRDYVYIPLGGNRVKKSRWILNLLAVWLLTGIWHGANWTFLVWGIIYFILLIVEKTTGYMTKVGFLSYPITLLFVMCNWVVFRSTDIVSAINYLKNMFFINVTSIIGDDFIQYVSASYLILIASFIGCTPLMRKLFSCDRGGVVIAKNIWIVMVFILSIIHAIALNYSPFIYFNF